MKARMPSKCTTSLRMAVSAENSPQGGSGVRQAMKQGRQYQPKRLRQRGVSLIEILVVLAILVLGILIIVELFPRGFFTIENTGTATLADSLAQELVEQQSQNAAGLPDAILPESLDANGLPDPATAMANYDPDLPNNLNNARLISNETITVPTPNGTGKSVYAVNYGPIFMASNNPVQMPQSLSINGLNWTNVSGSASENPKDQLRQGQPSFLMDFAAGQIAVPYASYSQNFVLTVRDNNDVVHTLYLTVPASESDPLDSTRLAYKQNTATNYNGNWFDPESVSLAYVTAQSPTSPATLATPWKAAMLFRPFHQPPMAGFDADPYEFNLVKGNMGAGANLINLGAVAFNPLAAGGNGLPALKAQISYQTYNWQIIHEDRDIPAITGAGGQYIARLTLKRLKTDLQSYPDADVNGTVTNVTYNGIADSHQDTIIMDLDTGQTVAPTGIVNEDTTGTSPTAISVGHSVGRLVFPSGAPGNATAHRIRVFYQVIGDWTAAIQKAPSQYIQHQAVANTAGNSLSPAEYAIDFNSKVVYFPRCDAGQTVEIDGITATLANGTLKTYPSVTAAIGDALTPTNGSNFVTLDLSHTITDTLSTTASPPVTFSAVRGLSTRAVVAWKENYRWKVHTVDTVLTRGQ